MAEEFDIDPRKLRAVDPWYWAQYSGLKLASETFTTHGHEHQIELLQDESPRQCFCKCTQAYGTEAYVLKALHGLRYGLFPKGVLYLFPTIDTVTDFSTTRFKPLIKDNPEHIGRFVRDTDRENLKRIQGGYLYFRGGRLGQTVSGSSKKSAHAVKSIPVDWVIFDEFDEMDKDVQPLAIARMADSKLKWETYLANPTIPDFGIDKVFRQSDQRYWELKCGACGKFTNLKLEFLANPPGCIKRERINGEEKVIRACKHCGREIFPKDGEWIPQYPEKAKDMVGRTLSHMDTANTDLESFLRTFEDSETDFTQFMNLDIGEAYIDAENRLTMADIYRCCTRDMMETRNYLPSAMGVDVGKVIHVVIGRPMPSGKQYKVTYAGRVGSFNDVHDLAKRHNVQSAVIDMEPETRKVRDFQANEPYKVFLCDYQERLKVGRKMDEKTGTITVRRTEILDTTHDVVTTPGMLEIPRQSNEIDEFAKEMCNVAKVLEEDKDVPGSRAYKYRKLGEDHYRHAFVYFYLACQEPMLLLPVFMTAEQQIRVYGMSDKDRADSYDPLDRR